MEWLYRSETYARSMPVRLASIARITSFTLIEVKGQVYVDSSKDLELLTFLWWYLHDVHGFLFFVGRSSRKRALTVFVVGLALISQRVR